MNQLTKTAIDRITDEEKDSKITTMVIYALLSLAAFGFAGIFVNHLAA